ncbi:MAG: hypothetical protein DWG76_07730 [Chloroflexi bacterium]|nr:hypothetical protein [Chloroflexota bacterium]MQC27316.1 hypothetical protein [Chloroflexota bacterium]
MDENELRQRIVDEFDSSEEFAASIALCADQSGDIEFLKSFEASMQALIEARQGSGRLSGNPLWIVLNFDRVLAGERLSYRRALKKYTNSIVFEDVGIGLMLVGVERVERIQPYEVNNFLRGLDEQIARQKSNTS